MRPSTIRGIWKWAVCAACLSLSPACSTPPSRSADTVTRDSAVHSVATAPPKAANAAASQGNPGEPLWRYRLTNGWLKSIAAEADSIEHTRPPETTAECQGGARVSRCPDGSCWAWKLQDVRCTGRGNPRDADWLHDLGDSSSVSISETTSEVKSDLPGRGVCFPEGKFDKSGKLVSLRLQCDWQCRVPEFGCHGQAEYEFTRDTLATLPRDPTR